MSVGPHRALGAIAWPYQAAGPISNPASGSGTTLKPLFTTSGTGSPFVIGVQVANATTLIAVSDYYWVRFTIGTSAYAASGGQSATVTVGNASVEIVADQIIDVLTNSAGACEIQVTATADIYVTAAVGCEKVYSSGVLTYSSTTPASPGDAMGLLLALAYS